MLSPAAVDRIARFLADAQVERIATALRRISGRESLREAVVTGVGEFIAVEAALRAGLTVARLADQLGRDASRTAPAAAVALLLSRRSGDDSETTRGPAASVTKPLPRPTVGTRGLSVIKVGGGVSATPGGLERIGEALARARRSARFVVIPGGGPFADTVRAFDAHAGLTAEAAHWMAILGMDQYAYALVAHTPGAILVEEAAQIGEALTSGMIPVLAPSRWLRAADELPHRWEVTSDSLAAYLAGLLGATQLVLIKPVGGMVDDLVDPWFRRTAPDGIQVDVLGYREIDQLEGLLRD
jgi:dihydroneopterin aldolase